MEKAVNSSNKSSMIMIVEGHQVALYFSDEPNAQSLHMDQQSRQCLMTEALVKYPLDDILDWHLILTAYRQIAYRDDLWSAYSWLGAWNTDNGFSDFRSWLISWGKEVYMKAIWAPRTLDSVPFEGERSISSCLATSRSTPMTRNCSALTRKAPKPCSTSLKPTSWARRP